LAQATSVQYVCAYFAVARLLRDLANMSFQTGPASARSRKRTNSSWWWGEGSKIAPIASIKDPVSRLTSSWCCAQGPLSLCFGSLWANKQLEELGRMRSSPSLSITHAVKTALDEDVQGDESTTFAKLHLHRDPGRSIAEAYDGRRVIGQGSFGSVYQARNRITGQERAIKVLAKSQVREDALFVEREIEAMLRLDHPNVVQFYEFFEQKETICVVTEYCAGGDFTKLLNGECLPEETRLLFRDVVTGVAYCHGLGIVHRDLKFENCLLTAGLHRRVAKVIDFGFSAIKRDDDEETEDTWLEEALGSWYFVAPEVVMKKPYGTKCDFWALGVMLYTLLAGRHPLLDKAAQPTARQAYQLVTKAPISFSALDNNPDVAPNARALVALMLVRDPAERIDAASALQQPWLQDTPELTFKDYLRKTGKKEFMTRIRTFAELPVFSKLALLMLAQQAAVNQVQDARAAFLAMDADNEGWLSKQDFKEAFASTGKPLTDEELENLYGSLDVNGNSKVSWVEWLSATISCQNFSSDAAAVELFNMLDVDGSGKITQEELGRVLGEEEAARVLQDLQLASSDGIGWNDFRGLVKQALQRGAKTAPQSWSTPVENIDRVRFRSDSWW